MNKSLVTNEQTRLVDESFLYGVLGRGNSI